MDEFLTRVEIERRVLRSVNTRFKEPSLAGLSPKALSTWVRSDKAERREIADRLSKVASMLAGAGYRGGSNSRIIDATVQQAVEDLLLVIGAETN